MRVLILGADGYLGWPLALRLADEGHDVAGVDNLFTRKAVEEVGSDSGLPILSPFARTKAAKEHGVGDIRFYTEDVTNHAKLREIIKKENPQAIVHFAEQRSAPYSMIDQKHAAYTMQNNIMGTINLVYCMKELCPKAHLVKMGTMGEFGTPNFDIAEKAFVNISMGGKRDEITFPKWAGSWYHWTKVHDTNNILFANKLWGVTATDIMQGPVYGTRTDNIKDKSLFTRFDFDGVWGTVLNRYCAEAVLGMPLTPYGKGGQVRAFLSLQDSMDALRLLIENPPADGEYRVVNQFRELHSVMELAKFTQEAGRKLGLDVEIRNVKNPRVEEEEHYYKVESKVLPALGFNKLRRNIKDEINVMLTDLMEYKGRLERYKGAIMPMVRWR